MTQQPVTFQQVTVSEAAAILGVSTQTVRRMIRRGQLEGERVHRAQGSAYVVSIPAPNTAGDADATATQQPAPNVSRSNATDQPAPAEAMVSLIQATIGTVLGPLVAELAAGRQANERLAGQVAQQAETIGELRAQNHALLARTETQSVEPTTGAPTARSSSTMWLTPRRFWLIAVLVLVLIGVGVVQVTVALYSLAVQLAMPG